MVQEGEGRWSLFYSGGIENFAALKHGGNISLGTTD